MIPAWSIIAVQYLYIEPLPGTGKDGIGVETDDALIDLEDALFDELEQMG